MIDESLADEALFLADGADIHDVAALVGTYRNCPAEVQPEFERELRAFVARKRLGTPEIIQPPPTKGWLARLLSYFRR